MLELTRKNNNIDFQLQTENVDITQTSVRLLVEVDGKTSVHPLKLPLSGHVTGKIPLEEAWLNKKGKILIEVVAGDTYFKLHEQNVKFDCPSLQKNIQISEVKFDATDVEDDGVIAPEPVNEGDLDAAIDQEMKNNDSRFETDFPTRELRAIKYYLKDPEKYPLPDSAKKVLAKLKAQLNEEEPWETQDSTDMALQQAGLKEDWPMSLATAVRKIQDKDGTEVPAKYAGRPVTIIKNDPNDETTWTVRMPNGEEVSFAETLANIRVSEEEQPEDMMAEMKGFFGDNSIDKKFQDSIYEEGVRYTLDHVRELRQILKPGLASRVRLTTEGEIHVWDSGRQEIMDTIYEAADSIHLKPWHMEFAKEFIDAEYVNEAAIYDDVFAALNEGEVSKPKKRKVIKESKPQGIEVKVNKSLSKMIQEGTKAPKRSINEFFNPEVREEVDTKALRRKMKLDNLNEEISLSKLL